VGSAALLDDVVGFLRADFERGDGDVAGFGRADREAEVGDLRDVGEFGLGFGVGEEGHDLVGCEARVGEECGDVVVGGDEGGEEGRRRERRGHRGIRGTRRGVGF
jgi:hypothetical protein